MRRSSSTSWPGRLLQVALLASALGCVPGKKPPCVGTEKDCGGVCRDLTSDDKNCGACGAACGLNESCQSSKCECRPTFKRCAGTCIDPQTDPANCGACGNACAASDTCVDGQCQCQPPRGICNGVCVDLSSDPSNCGACGVTCADGFACIGGACVCGPGHAVCKGQCVNLQTDTSNCGACGNACAEGQSCVDGICQCPDGETLCHTTCRNLDSDQFNCGACDHACPAVQFCAHGECVCPPDETLCGDACVDTQTDPANCGACGNVCPPGQTCQAGTCHPSATGVTWSGTASEQADLDDGFGDVVHRHQSVTVTWTQLPQDPTGNTFTASGTTVITLNGTSGPCTTTVLPTTFAITGTLQLFPGLSPPTYSADGIPTGSCLEVTFTCPDGTSQLCSDLKPWLEIAQIPLPPNANTLAGTTPTVQGVSYQWSFTRSPPLP